MWITVKEVQIINLVTREWSIAVQNLLHQVFNLFSRVFLMLLLSICNLVVYLVLACRPGM
jgi:hypothetical protein